MTDTITKMSLFSIVYLPGFKVVVLSEVCFEGMMKVETKTVTIAQLVMH